MNSICHETYQQKTDINYFNQKIRLYGYLSKYY